MPRIPRHDAGPVGFARKAVWHGVLLPIGRPAAFGSGRLPFVPP